MRKHAHQSIALLLLLLSCTAWPAPPNGCGEYVLSGKLERHGQRVELVIDGGTRNETRLRLEDFPSVELLAREGTKIKVLAKVRALNKAGYATQADTVEVLGTPDFEEQRQPVRLKKASPCAR